MTEPKIQTLTHALPTLRQWKEEGKKIVFTNGCFDILHIGHVDYLEKSRALGDVLVIGLNTDASISRIKGPSRPIVGQHSRSRVIAALEAVSMVIFFDEDTPKSLIEAVEPDILVKGDDYTVENIIGADFVLSQGGTVQTVPLVKGFSTSAIIAKIRTSG